MGFKFHPGDDMGRMVLTSCSFSEKREEISLEKPSVGAICMQINVSSSQECQLGIRIPGFLLVMVF